MASPATDPGELARDYRLLRHELRLAGENPLYFVFDLPQQTVSFRAKGLSVVFLPVAGWGRWGPRTADRIAILTGKESLSAPQRTRIRVAPVAETPALTEAGNLDALELDDMPLRYRLILDDGTVIRVIPVQTGIFARILAGMRWLAWYLSRPLISDWNFLRGKTYTELVLALQPDDARLLYWSFTAGGRCLLRWPAP
ncbi:hypothetical protein [Desulfuromonas sp. DDH964]|uniref:hypothetical protein n=1 Tax=Desulfuromonas sp. DDH964 TaxID=1823759 RepID=UPI0012F92F1D|nr:hypothetical protein [Desulfuromonas sp. DDH964]